MQGEERGCSRLIARHDCIRDVAVFLCWEGGSQEGCTLTARVLERAASPKIGGSRDRAGLIVFERNRQEGSSCASFSQPSLQF